MTWHQLWVKGRIWEKEKVRGVPWDSLMQFPKCTFYVWRQSYRRNSSLYRHDPCVRASGFLKNARHKHSGSYHESYCCYSFSTLARKEIHFKGSCCVLHSQHCNRPNFIMNLMFSLSVYLFCRCVQVSHTGAHFRVDQQVPQSHQRTGSCQTGPCTPQH